MPVRKTRKPVPNWHPTGYRGKLCTEVQMHLLGGLRATCWRRSSGRWSWFIGPYAHEKWRVAHFKSLNAAKLAAEDAVIRVLKRNLTTLKAGG